MARLRGLAPLLPADGAAVRALILGSFPSVASLRTQQYYAHPGNWFWRVIERCGLIPDATAPYPDRVDALTARGVAVWDLYARVEREGSGDDRIRNAITNDVSCLWQARGPFPVLLNGRRLREWRRHFGQLPGSPLALPSTSPRPLHWNTPASRRAAIQEWRDALTPTLQPEALQAEVLPAEPLQAPGCSTDEP